MKNLKHFFLLVATMIAGAVITSCSGTDDYTMETQPGTQPATRSVDANKVPKLTTYIETNDVNPLNAGEYYFTGTDEQVIDNVILFASNIRGTANTVQLYHNDNQTYILNNASTLIAPLQAKGIKVSLGLLGDHTGVGFANLTPAMIESFAQQIAACVTKYKLDGVDFDDEYAEYWKAPSILPVPSTTIFGNLVKRVRQLLPGKLVTVFYYGGYTGFDSATMNAISYMWPDFGVWGTPSGLGNGKWARMSIHCTDGRPSTNQIENAADTYSGYGAIMMFNFRNTDQSGLMNHFASRVWGGKTVSYTGNSYTKNY